MITAIPKTITIFVLGVIVPLALLVQAYFGVMTLSDRVGRVSGGASAVETYMSVRSALRSGNDYSLISTMLAEKVNASVVVNKQIMKIVVIQIGFSTISIGLMFIVLGISDGGGSGSIAGGGVNVDFKTGSTGALIFMIGAAMAGAGGILKNDYSTVPIPRYVDRPAQDDLDRYSQSIQAYRNCNEMKRLDPRECFFESFRKINGGPLQ